MGRNTAKSFINLFHIILIMSLMLFVFTGCSEDASSVAVSDEETTEQTGTNVQENPYEALTGQLKLIPSEGPIHTDVQFQVQGLEPNVETKIIWETMEGSFQLEELFSFVGAMYEPKEVELFVGVTNSEGILEGVLTIPEDFGGDHDVMVFQNDTKVAQANFFVETTFSIYPESGPIGTEINIIGEGLGWRMYGSLWHLNYDNAYTGMLTAVSSNGTAHGVIRASGNVGDHTITIESGASGFPYMNRVQSAVNFIDTQRFTFTITDDVPAEELTYVEDVPKAADGGLMMPPLENKEGITITLDKDQGIVDEIVTMKGNGLPPNTEISIVWNTMVGSRVTSAGFWEEASELDKVMSDNSGNFKYEFTIPDDLGGPPHRIDIMVGEENYGQAYLRILPSIVAVTPSSGPVGTEFTITMKGAGWTEYDNAYHVTYNNAFIGYVCGFNSQGTINIPLVASGNEGYQLIDIYPGIYKGQQTMPDIFLRPQLTYQHDHPGTAIPALRVGFEITNE